MTITKGFMRRRYRAVLAVIAAAAMIFGIAAPSFADIDNAPARTWSVNGRVLAILPLGAQVLVAGTFTQVIDTSGRTYPASNIALFNPTTGTFDTSWQGGANDTVNALAVSGSTLYIGGNFSQADGVARRKLAALNLSTGALVNSWAPAVDGQVDQVAVVGDNVYASGVFQNVTDSSGTYLQPYLVRFDLTNGVMDQSWKPAPDGRVRTVIGSADGSHVFIGGDFTSVSGAMYANTSASLLVSNGSVDPAYRPAPNNTTQHASVYDLQTDGTNLYLAVGGGGGACTAENATTGANVWTHHTNGNLQAVRIVGSTLYCGGHFNGSGSFDGFDRNKLAAVDIPTGTVLPFAPIVNSALGVWYMGSDSGHLYVGGDFTKISGIPQGHFAMFTNTTAQTAPDAAMNLAAQAGNNAAFLSWLPPSSDGGSKIKDYAVYRAIGNATLKQVGTAKSAVYTDNTAKNGTSYTYQVMAINAIGKGPGSNSATVMPKQGAVTAPGAPTNVVANGQAGQVTLSWSGPTNNGGSPVTGYTVLRGTSTGQETAYATVGPDTNFVDTAVTVNQRYYYEVQAVNAVGASTPSGEATAAPNSGAPSPPTLVGVVLGNSIVLTWNYPNDNGSPVTKFSLVRNAIRIGNPLATTFAYTDTALTSGTLYKYQIKAINAVGASKYSNTVMLTAP